MAGNTADFGAPLKYFGIPNPMEHRIMNLEMNI
jgi:hypothetical protein